MTPPDSSAAGQRLQRSPKDSPALQMMSASSRVGRFMAHAG